MAHHWNPGVRRGFVFIGNKTVIESRKLAILLMASAAVLCVAAYWIGLGGTFVFDDGPNFAPIEAWLAGKIRLEQVLFGNTSLLTNRSLAMGSFALGAQLFGYTPFSFKAINLALHLVCGVVAFFVLRQMVARDPAAARHADMMAAVVVACWLLHPFNVSTVLYAVQRMSQIAALSCLLGIWLYLGARRAIENGASTKPWIAIFVGIPLLTLLGIQGKQSAVVLPGLCLVVELACFGESRRGRIPLLVFFALTLALPAFVLIAGALARPDLLLNGFSQYDFSLTDRLLSEGRVLVDYIRMLLLPTTPSMGVYTDDYLPSRGLFDPPSTALSLFLLAGASIAAIALRKRLPMLFAGWFFFLVAHSVEASILPIELYYEHRNYLPSLGLFLAVADIVRLTGEVLSARGLRIGRIGATVLVALLLVLTLQTHGRARVWSDRVLLAESELANHPDSVRAVVNYAWLAKSYGDTARAKQVLRDAIGTSASGKVRGLARIFLIRLDCEDGLPVAPHEISRALEDLPPHIDLTMTQIMGYSEYLDSSANACKGISRREFADALATQVDRANKQDDQAYGKWMLRYHAASLYAADQDWQATERQAKLAWQPNSPAVVAGPLVMAYAANGKIAEAERVYREAALRSDASRPEDAAGLAGFRSMIEAAKRRSQRATPEIAEPGRAGL